MHKLIIPAIIITLATSACTQRNSTDDAATNEPTDIDSVAYSNGFTLNSDVSSAEIDLSGILMFPLEIIPGAEKGSKLFSYIKGRQGGQNWNIIFYNTRTQEQYLLSENKILIISHEDSRLDKQHIFYKIINNDYNQDKVLDYKDPQYLFISNKQGKQLTQISPPDCDLRTWEYVKATNKIIMTVTKDNDHNKTFDDKDEVAIYEYQPGVSTTPVEVLKPDFKDKLKQLFNKDWKPKTKQD